jgi:ATP-dependent DNA helicase PIF1
MTEKELINETYPDLQSENFNILNLSNRVMVAAKNSKVDEINSIATDMMIGDSFEAFSSDSLVKDAQQALFPTEFLNKINISGLPPHKLTLKVGQPVIMLRNLNANEGICNGTRLTIKKIHTRIIECEIIFGTFAGKKVYVPKIPLIPSDTNLPFDFIRTQYPVRPAFCISINKSQGQTLDFISIWLGDDHVFTHGQLYVALSRVSCLNNIKIATNNENKFTRNVVFKEIFIK